MGFEVKSVSLAFDFLTALLCQSAFDELKMNHASHPRVGC
jgi:hypothetical protein